MTNLHDVPVHLDATCIQKRVAEVATQIQQDYAGRPLCVVGILSGALMFVADLIRHLPMHLQLDFITVSSYQATSSTGDLKHFSGPNQDLTGLDVLLVDDILDTGLTLKRIRKLVESHNPKSVRTCVLLDKPDKHSPELKADYVGFEVENAFVVGYGMDCDGLFRNLPYIGILPSGTPES